MTQNRGDGGHYAATAARTGETMFAVRPVPERGGTCPRCDEQLAIARLRFPGCRSLLEGDCPTCGHRYLQDLPSGHGLVYPTTVDLDTGDVFDPAGATWFSHWLKPAWGSPDGSPVELTIDVHAETSEVVLLNCLDVIYGHSVLKLLNVQRELERAGSVGCVLLIPQALVPLVPVGVAETWVVREPIPRLHRWLSDLEERLAVELERFARCWLSPAFPHPHPSTYDVGRLIASIEPRRFGNPSIVLSLRDDRPWGSDPAAQTRNVAELWKRLRHAFPEAGAAAIGVGGRTALPPGMHDARSLSPDEDTERRWLAFLRGADLAIGVHGSNMLLPSGIAEAAIELIPEERYGHAFQATLVRERDPLSALGHHRTIYGDNELTDVSPSRLAALAISLLAGLERFDSLMRGPAAGEGEGEFEVVPASRAVHPPTEPSFADRVRAAGWRGVAGYLGGRARATTVRFAGSAQRPLERRRARRIGPLPVVLRDARGLLFELETYNEVESFLRLGGHFEREELEFAARYLEAGMTAFDVGASIGAFTASFARSVGPDGAVHAFEPLEASRRRLLRTIELNELRNVTVSPSALADEPGTAALYTYGPGFESWSTLAPRAIELEPGRLLEAREHAAVPTTTLDHYCQDAQIAKIDLVKIDVEGAEQRVLAGAGRLLAGARIDVVLVEVSDNTLAAAGAAAYRLLELLEDHGLRPHRLDDGRLLPFRVAGRFDELATAVALSRQACARLGI